MVIPPSSLAAQSATSASSSAHSPSEASDRRAELGAARAAAEIEHVVLGGEHADPIDVCALTAAASCSRNWPSAPGSSTFVAGMPRASLRRDLVSDVR